ncbi:MAG: hypothetical protein IJS69_06600 [Selenomonadaceae bacterium]|nr:hypothetical protein [Selenomonadaceae bacterium]
MPEENSPPFFESDDIAARVEKFLEKRFFCSPWSKFLRRDFLIANKIFLPQMKIADDILWTFKIICLAEKILRVPSRLYVHRANNLSVSRLERPPKETVSLWINPLITAAELFEEFMSTLEYFKRSPDRRLQVLIFFLDVGFLDDIEKFLEQIHPAEVYEIILKDFSAAGSSHPALIAGLIVMLIIHRHTLKERSNS